MTNSLRFTTAALVSGLLALPAHAEQPSAATAPVQREQPSTLFGAADMKVTGGFGGVGVMYTRLAGNDVPAVCGEGGIIFGHALTLGGGGCGVTAAIDAEAYGPPPHDPDDRLGFGYGGLIARYHFFSKEVANFAVGFLVGAGGLGIAPFHEADEDGGHRTHGEGMFVFEPHLAGYVNLTQWMRIGVKGGYRLVSKIQTEGLDTDDIGGVMAGGQLQFGWF